MATQQPLSGRGLSRTVLTPPDILGERMQLEQLGLRQDALRASQMGKQPTLKPYEFKEPNEYGDLFSSSRGKVADLIYNYFKDDIYALNPNNSQYYDPDKAQQARNLVAQANQLAALTKTQDKLWREVNDEQTPYELRAGRALNYMYDAAKMGDNLSIENGVFMYQDPETGEKVPALDAKILQNPDYMKFIGADEFFDKEVPTIKQTIESQLKEGNESITTSQGKQDWIKERIVYKLGTARNRDALVRDIVLNKMINDGGYTDPEQIDPQAYEQLLEDEQYVERAIGEFADAKSRDISLKAGFSQTVQGDGDLNISIGSARNKLGMVDKEALPAPSTGGDRFVGVAKSVDKLTIQTPEGSKVITELYVDPNGIVYYGGSEARFKTKEELDNLSQQYGGIDQVPSEKYFNAFSKHYERAAADEMDSMRSAITRITGFPLNSNNELAGFIGFDGTRREEIVDSEQEEIVENPTQEQYDALPDGAKYIYNGQTYTKGE